MKVSHLGAIFLVFCLGSARGSPLAAQHNHDHPIFTAQSDVLGTFNSQAPDFPDLEFEAQYGLGAVDADIAFLNGFTGSGVPVAIFDVAADPFHPEFLGRISTSFDMFTGTEIAAGDGRHGTHVTGIVAASYGNGGMMGVAPEADIVPVAMLRNRRVTNEELEEFSEAAFDFAIENNVVVMNNSWGNNAPITFPDLKEAIDLFKPNYMRGVQKAAAAGIVTVRSAGNNRQSETGYYAALPYLYPELEDTWIAAVSLDQSGEKSVFSNACGLAANWCIAAPGSGIFSTAQDGGYAVLSGTSMAAPHVTGAVVIAKDVFPNASGPQLRNIVLQTATDIGEPGIDAIYGWGRLNIGNIVMASDPDTAAFHATSTWSRFETIDNLQSSIPRTRLSSMLDRFDLQTEDVVVSRRNSQPALEPRRGWISGTRSRSQLEDSGNLAGGRVSTNSVVLGYDFTNTETLRAGLGVGFSSTELTGARAGDFAVADGMHILGYVDWSAENWFISGVGQIARFDQSITRANIMGVGSSLNPVGESNFSVVGYSLDLRAGYDFNIDSWTLSPYLAANGRWQSIRGFAEAGAGAFALSSTGASSYQTEFGPGIMVETPPLEFGRMKVKAGLDLTYLRLSGDRDNLTRVNLLGSQLDARTAELGHDVIKVGFGVKMVSRDERLEGSLSYEGSFNKNSDAHAISAALVFRF